MTLYLATGNKHKKDEMTKICAEHTILIPNDKGISFDPEETGLTFIENSLIKAKALWEIVKEPVLADDSGICVEALDGIPGIYSARYEGREFPKGRVNKNSKLTQSEQNILLLDHLNESIASNPKKSRKCHYVCAMVLYYGEDQFLCVQETMKGILVNNIDEACGNGGFGYDPIVFLPEHNKTVAELTDEEKNIISHRGKATRKILAFFSKIGDLNGN